MVYVDNVKNKAAPTPCGSNERANFIVINLGVQLVLGTRSRLGEKVLKIALVGATSCWYFSYSLPIFSVVLFEEAKKVILLAKR